MITDGCNAHSVVYSYLGPAAYDVTIALSSPVLRGFSADSGDVGHVGHRFKLLQEIEPANFDILIVPDRLGNPHRENYDPDAVAVVRHFLREGKAIEFGAGARCRNAGEAMNFSRSGLTHTKHFQCMREASHGLRSTIFP